MIYEGLNHNPKNKHNYIKAGGKVFHNDIEALAHVTSLIERSGSGYTSLKDKEVRNYKDINSNYNNGIAQYLARKGFLEYCMKGVDPEDDWKTEPEQTFHELCDRLCGYIEQNYDDINISYSGGTDSDTIAEAFLRRGTRNVTLINVANLPVQKRTGARQWIAHHTGEAVKVKYAQAIANLGWKVLMFQGWQPTDVKHYEKSFLEKEFLSWTNDYHNVHAYAQNSGEVTLGQHSKRSCWVVGLEKPHITVSNGWYCFQMSHDTMDVPLSCVDPNSDLIHFWVNDIVPALIKKMSHAKCQEIKNIFKEQAVTATKQTVEHMNKHTCKYYQRINRAMGLGGLTKFLMTADTHAGEWRSKDLAQQRDLIADDKQLLDKMLVRDRYFDQVIVKVVHNELLDLNLKGPRGIYSKPIPIIPVEQEHNATSS